MAVEKDSTKQKIINTACNLSVKLLILLTVFLDCSDNFLISFAIV